MRFLTLALLNLAMMLSMPMAAWAAGESLGEQLLEGLEDVLLEEAPIEADPPTAPRTPLQRVEQGMRTAEALLARPSSMKQTVKVQRQVVAELDALIAQLEKQKPCGDCQKKGSSAKRASDRPSNKPGQGNSAARDSTDRLNQSATPPADSGLANKASMRELLKNLWGHLPARSREQMLQSFSGEFLPQYELEIEQYFRRLAEEDHVQARRASE